MKTATTQRLQWTADRVATLRQLYPDYAADIVARVIGGGCRVSAVHAKAKALGVKKSDAFKASDRSGRIQRGQQPPAMRATQFKPGQAPWNKGLSYVAGGRSAETRFKKGTPAEQAHNYLPIGSVRVTKDGYLERKVTDDPSLFPARRWVAVQRLVWEAVHGPVPKGHMVVFKPGMRTIVEADITIDRVECISRAENARRNHPAAKSPEYFKLVQLKGAITRQVQRINRETQEKETTA